jgi:hypothetical protein
MSTVERIKLVGVAKVQLCAGLSNEEFECPCGKCRGLMPQLSLLVAYSKLRRSIGPTEIFSGGRCPEYNANFDKSTGKHADGLALDIGNDNLRKMGKIKAAELAAECGFSAMGWGNGIIHVDTRPMDPAVGFTAWGYKPNGGRNVDHLMVNAANAVIRRNISKLFQD